MPPEDYELLAAALPGEVRILDTFRVTVTSASSRIRAEIGVLERPATLIGHSMGGLAALEWVVEDPHNVKRIVLLDPSLPTDPVVRWMLPGTVAHRVIRGLFGAIGRIPVIARSIGRAGRAQLLGMYDGLPDRLTRTEVDRIFGNRAALVSSWDQVCERFALQLRMREVDVPPRIRMVQVVGVKAPVGAVEGQREFAASIGATVVEVDEGHLFASRSPELVAAIVLG